MCRSRSSLIGGAKKSHGKISRPNPIGKHIQVLQQNRSHSCRAHQQPARRFMTHLRHRLCSAALVRRCLVYSITLSARTRNVSGIVSPSAFAVVRLTTKSNLVGCSTGMSAGLVPRRI